MTEHELGYTAGRHGFAAVGLPDTEPHWHCSCDAGWKFPAKAMPTRTAGNNRIEAERAHERHRKALR